jgi:hypothetical protein
MLSQCATGRKVLLTDDTFGCVIKHTKLLVGQQLAGRVKHRLATVTMVWAARWTGSEVTLQCVHCLEILLTTAAFDLVAPQQLPNQGHGGV